MSKTNTNHLSPFVSLLVFHTSQTILCQMSDLFIIFKEEL